MGSDGKRTCPRCGQRVEIAYASGVVWLKNHKKKNGEWCKK